jgi:hypothetical protein
VALVESIRRLDLELLPLRQPDRTLVGHVAVEPNPISSAANQRREDVVGVCAPAPAHPTPVTRSTNSQTRHTARRPTQVKSLAVFQTMPMTTLSIFDSEHANDDGNDGDGGDGDDDNNDETLRLHVSNIPFTWSKEKLADVFGVGDRRCRLDQFIRRAFPSLQKYGTTFDVEVVYNERGSKVSRRWTTRAIRSTLCIV